MYDISLDQKEAEFCLFCIETHLVSPTAHQSKNGVRNTRKIKQTESGVFLKHSLVVCIFYLHNYDAFSIMTYREMR